MSNIKSLQLKLQLLVDYVLYCVGRTILDLLIALLGYIYRTLQTVQNVAVFSETQRFPYS